MKQLLAIFLLIAVCLQSGAQFYLRGEVRDELNNPLGNARILLHSTQYVYRSGAAGAFGIMTGAPKDSITITLDGYIPSTYLIEAGRYQVCRLKTSHLAPVVNRNRLLSFTRNLKINPDKNFETTGETYSSLLRNDFIQAQKFPETGFAIHSDKASYSNTRRLLNMNSMVPPDAIRPEEMLNYFNLGFIEPSADSTFAFHSYVSDCPWNPLSRLLFLQLSARRIDPRSIPPSNLVFLIDVSGSMDLPNRLPLLKSSFKLLVNNLREKDTISIVTYGATTAVWLKPTCGTEKEKIRKAIEELTPGGSTPGEAGIRAAYRLAKSQYVEGGNNRVILATDGDFNVGQSSEEELETLITQHQQHGIYLSCLGVGMGNYKDSKLEVLARKGNGNFSYLDNEREAEKVLVKEFTQTLYTVADDAYLNITFNSEQVGSYRLIGYDNKSKAIADTMSKVEGGEIGSGHNSIVLFEVFPRALAPDKELAYIEVFFKAPYDSSERKQVYSCKNNYVSFAELPAFYRFAASLSLFSELLFDSKYVKGMRFKDVYALAEKAADPSDYLQQEFLTLIKKAEKIYRKRKIFNIRI